MKRSKSQHPQLDPASKDAIRYQAAREVIEKVESRLAEEEDTERIQKPGQIMVRVLVGILLVAWIIVMTWIALKSLRKQGANAKNESLATSTTSAKDARLYRSL